MRAAPCVLRAILDDIVAMPAWRSENLSTTIATENQIVDDATGNSTLRALVDRVTAPSGRRPTVDVVTGDLREPRREW